jgi:hypothetical protein
MTDERGYTIVELLVAAAVMLAVLAAVSMVLHAAILRVPWLEESTDLQQRTRAALELLSADLRSAGAGDPSARLAVRLPAVLPRTGAAAPTVASASALTVRYVPAGGAAARLGAPLLPADAVVVVAAGGACVSNAVACGFRAGSTALVFDGSGQADLLDINGIAPGALTTTPVSARTASYPIGADVAELLDVSYTLDPVARVLQRQAGGAPLPVADNVTALAFEYAGIPGRPLEPVPPLGIANCLYDAGGTYLHPILPASGPYVVILPGELADGPFCGSGALAYDVDLLRIRAVQVRLRLDTGADALRGTDPRFFARPGPARDGRVIHDVELTQAVALRNVGR